MKGTLGIPTIRPGGKLGNLVFMRYPDGYVVRERVIPANPRTAAQLLARHRLAVASQSWGRLSDEAWKAWLAYGEQQGRPGREAYLSLARRWLSVHGEGTPPEMPPAGTFFGDAVQPIFEAGTGGLRVSSDRPNAPGVVTEVLVQSLPHLRRKPRARDWRTAGFVALSPDPVVLPVPGGALAVAYRFVESASGRATAMAEGLRLTIDD